MRLVDIPSTHKIKDYDDAIDLQVASLSKVKEVKAIYQIGGVSTPGISDIDLVVVFKNDFRYNNNPRANNSNIGNYLFTHGLYGASETDFKDSLKYTFFHNYKLLYGKNFNLENSTPLQDQILLKKQIALEFLFKMYINLAVQKSYNTIKLRALFLHIRALPYDFEFLNINPLKLTKQVEEGIALRNNWLKGSVTKKDVTVWFRLFFIEFESFLSGLFKEFNLYAIQNNFKIAPNIEIQNAAKFGYSKSGIVFPDPLNLLDKKYFKILNRINNFKIHVPLQLNAPNIISEYFEYTERASINNEKDFPFFMALTSSLKVYK